MIISCPSCSARYAVEASKIGPRGRTVKCARCGHSWVAPPPPPEELAAAAAPAPVPPPRPGVEIDDNYVQENGETEDRIDPGDFRATFDAAMARDDAARGPATEPREPSARPSGRRDSGRQSGLPAVRREPSRWPARLAWLLLFAVVAGVIGGAVVFRDEIVSAWPPAERLYEAVGLAPAPIESRLGVRNVKYAFGTGDDAQVLTVQGEVVNISGSPTDVPDLRVVFFSSGGQVLQRWVFAPPEKRMLPSESVKFSTRVDHPPAEAKHIEVGFDTGRP